MTWVKESSLGPDLRDVECYHGESISIQEFQELIYALLSSAVPLGNHWGV